MCERMDRLASGLRGPSPLVELQLVKRGYRSDLFPDGVPANVFAFHLKPRRNRIVRTRRR